MDGLHLFDVGDLDFEQWRFVMTGFLAKKIFGFAVGTWLKGAFVAAAVAAVGALFWQYNAGQRAIERADQLEQTLKQEREAHDLRIEAYEDALEFVRRSNQIADERRRALEQEEARIERESEELRQTFENPDEEILTEDELLRLNRILGYDR